MERRADPQVPPPAKSNQVGSFSAGLAKVPFGRVAVFTFLLFLHSCSGLNLHSDLEKIQAFTGETVVLPCLINVSGELPTVEWSKEGLTPNITFLYRDGCETFDMKNKAFRDRTNLIMNELKNGNISQMIFNIELTDAGKYQCVVVRGRTRDVVKTLELVVGASSEPKLSVVPGAGSGVTLACEASCWFPEPSVTFVDDQGNVMRADDPERTGDPRGCVSITRRMTLSTAPNRVLCRVHEPRMNKTSVKEIYYIRGDCLSWVIPVCITLLLTVIGSGAFFFLRQKCGSAKPPPGFECSDAPDNRNYLQVDMNEELNQLCDRDEKTPKLNPHGGSPPVSPSDNSSVHHSRSQSPFSGSVARSPRKNTFSSLPSNHNGYSPVRRRVSSSPPY